MMDLFRGPNDNGGLYIDPRDIEDESKQPYLALHHEDLYKDPRYDEERSKYPHPTFYTEDRST